MDWSPFFSQDVHNSITGAVHRPAAKKPPSPTAMVSAPTPRPGPRNSRPLPTPTN